MIGIFFYFYYTEQGFEINRKLYQRFNCVFDSVWPHFWFSVFEYTVYMYMYGGAQRQRLNLDNQINDMDRVVFSKEESYFLDLLNLNWINWYCTGWGWTLDEGVQKSD